MSNTLTFGPGTNTLTGTAAGLNGDTIMNWLPGDRIQITDLTASNVNVFTFDNWLIYNGGHIVIGSGAFGGRDVVRNIPGGGVEIRLQQDAHNDFTGIGRSDILLRNNDGSLAELTAQPDGSFVGNANANYALGVNWHVVGTGDFNGGGIVGLLLRNDNGALAEWTAGLAQSTAGPRPDGSFVGNAAVNYPLGLDWQIAGTGDFNGDGRSDILLRNINGNLAEWTAQADGSFVGNANANYALGVNWHVVGTGDFNGDGIDDLLLRNDNGALAEWTGKSDGTFVGNASANYALLPEWQVAAVGDFNGDGQSDILLRNINGTLAEWTGKSDGSFVGNPDGNYALGLAWHIGQVGDFNGDGKDDLLLRNDNGLLAEWTGQSDGSFVSNPSVNYPLGPAWHVQDPFVHDTIV